MFCTKDLNNFDIIAPYYDELVSWAPYETWIADILSQFKKRGLKKGSRILDAACGSGLSTLPLARRGFKVTGVDRSDAMLALARQKAEREGLKLKLIRGELTDFETEEQFDAALCMHSGFDYILDLDLLQKAFVNVRKCLKNGGLFAFDKCLDEDDFYLRPQTENRKLSDARAVLHYRWYKKQRIFEQDCCIFYEDENGEMKTCRMLQHMRAVDADRLVEMVEQSGFKTLKKPRPFTICNPGMGIFRAV